MDIPSSISFPLLGVGALTFILSILFCCYLWRLKKRGEIELGYKKAVFRQSSHLKKIKNDTCPVCLDEFLQKEQISLSPCHHGFHYKCLSQWLRQHRTCPMCKTQIRPVWADERTILVISSTVSHV